MNELKPIARRLLGRDGSIPRDVSKSLEGQWEPIKEGETLEAALNDVLTDHARNTDIGADEKLVDSFVTTLLNSRIRKIKED